MTANANPDISQPEITNRIKNFHLVTVQKSKSCKTSTLPHVKNVNRFNLHSQNCQVKSRLKINYFGGNPNDIPQETTLQGIPEFKYLHLDFI